MGQIVVPEESWKEDDFYERAVQRQLDDEAARRALDKLNFGERYPDEDLDPARGVIFGTLCGLALITWATFAVWRLFL